MCFDYNEDSVCLASPAPRKARKPHRCEDCRRTIQPGEVYVYGLWKYEDSLSASHICANCKRVRDVIYRRELAHGCESWESHVPYGDGILAEYLSEVGPELADLLRAEAGACVALVARGAK